MEIKITPNQIALEFESGVGLVELLQYLDFYIKQNKGGIVKILLCTKKNEIMWYNDITAFKEKHLLFLHLHMKNIKPKEIHQDSGASEGELSIYCKLIIETVNKVNAHPVLKTRIEFLTELYLDWLAQA